MIKVAFSFDDGRSDQYDAFKILKRYKLKASFHITTGFIDCSFNGTCFGNNRKPLTVEQLKEMFDGNMDISSHGDKHTMEDCDFKASFNKLKQWGLVDDKVGFSIPNSDYNNDLLQDFYQNNKEKLLYVRIGRSSKCYSFLNKFFYLMYHIFHFQYFYNRFNKCNLQEKINTNELVSLVIKKDSKSKSVIRFIEKYKNTNSLLVLMFHSVLKRPLDKWEYSIEEFEKICKYLKSADIKVLTLKEVAKQEE